MNPGDPAATRSVPPHHPAARARASLDARRIRHLSRVLALLLVALLAALLLRAGRDVLAEGERMALQMAEQHLENLVWLEGQRALAEEGPAGLQRRAGTDPRRWPQDRLSAPPAGGVPTWVDARWTYDDASGELRYHPAWLPGGVWRWRVEARREGVDSPSPGLARDLLLVRIAPAGDASTTRSRRNSN